MSSTLAGTEILDLTWISDRRGWALVATPCASSGTCGELFSTADGGGTWTRLASEPGVVHPADFRQCQTQGCVEHVRFASATIGYLWSGDGSGSLFMTADGGRSWARRSSPQIIALEIAPGSAFRVVAPESFPGPMAVDRAAIGSSHWKRIDVGASRDFGGAIATSGKSVYVAFFGHTAGGAVDAHTVFARSADSGVTWNTFGDPCATIGGIEHDASEPAAGPNGTFAVLCVPRQGDGPITLMTSADSGRHFRSPLPLPTNALDPHQPVRLAVPSMNVAVVASTGSAPQPSVVLWSGDRGRTWQRELTAPGTQGGRGVPEPWLGFEDSHTGRVAFGGGSLWTSTDGGRSWLETQVP